MHHAVTVDATLISLDVTPKGLSQDEAERRLREFGANCLPAAPRRNPFFRFLAHFHHIMFLAWALLS